MNVNIGALLAKFRDDVGMFLAERSRDIGGDPVILLTG